MRKRNIAALMSLLMVLSIMFSACSGTQVNGSVAKQSPNKQTEEDKGTVLDKEGGKITPVVLVEGELPSFASMEELRAKIEEQGSYGYYGGMGIMTDGIMNQAESVAGSADVSRAEAPSKAVDNNFTQAESDSEHSSTNSQVEGVEEGEIIKTDGKYIYTVAHSKVSIIEVNGKEMKVSSVVKVDGSEGISEIYIVGDKMVTVGYRSETIELPKVRQSEEKYKYHWFPNVYTREYTVYSLYDIKDRTSTKLEQNFEVSGRCLATRVMNGNLYYVTSTNTYYNIPFDIYTEEKIAFDDSQVILPRYNNTVYTNGKGKRTEETINATSIKFFPDSRESAFIMVGALDLSGKEQSTPRAYFGGGENFYMNTENIIIACQNWGNDGSETDIYKFTVSGLQVAYTEKGKVSGYPLNQYSMDMYKGNFRIATTDWSNGNHMYVLGPDMQKIGSVLGMAKGEQIRSVRFMDDIAYMVTFRNMDPLFAIDLSDPTKPTVLGELKIPGFSQYLHPIGEGLLVGFGRDTEAVISMRSGKPEVTGFRDIGLKISLFDVSNPKDPQEISKLTYSDENFYSEAFTNPRAIMVDSKKSCFGFPLLGYDGDIDNIELDKIWYGGMLISIVNGKELKETTQLVHGRFSEDNIKDVYYIEPEDYTTRMVYIGDTLYMLGVNKITAFSYSSFETLASLKGIFDTK